MRVLLALLCLALFASPTAVSSKPTPSKVYVVVFQVTVDAEGRVSDLKLERVNDPDLPGSAEEVAKYPVNVAIPARYLAAAKAFLGQKRYDPQRRTFYTFTFYDPTQPDRADLYSD